jgi:hypothetical protein
VDRLTAEDQLMLWPDEIWPQEIGALAILDGSSLAGPGGRPGPTRARAGQHHQSGSRIPIPRLETRVVLSNIAAPWPMTAPVGGSHVRGERHAPRSAYRRGR